MSSNTSALVAKHRARGAREGFIRVEISVLKKDAERVREVAAALADPARHAAARTLLRKCLSPPQGVSLKALLTGAPIDNRPRAQP